MPRPHKSTAVFNLAANGAMAEIIIRGIIGDYWDGNDQSSIAYQITQCDPQAVLTLRINSRGGDVNEGIAIFNALRAHPGKKIACIEGICASTATIIVQACDEIRMPANTIMMVHNPQAGVFGDAREHEAAAVMLRTYGQALLTTYQVRTEKKGVNAETLQKLLDDETYMTAAQAVAYGFADVVEAIADDAALVTNLATALDIPPEVLAAMQALSPNTPPGSTSTPTPTPPAASGSGAPTPTTAPFATQIKAACDAAGLAEYAPVFALDAAITNAETLQTAIDQAQEITALCALAGKADASGNLIRSRYTLPEARARLVDSRAAEDERQQIDNKLPVTSHHHQPTAPVAKLSIAAVYASRKTT